MCVGACESRCVLRCLSLGDMQSVRVTVQHPGTAASCYVIVRGCENLPITVGALTLPTTSKLTLHRIESKTFAPLDW